MVPFSLKNLLLSLAVLPLLAACDNSTNVNSVASSAVAKAPATAEKVALEVFKSPTCGCCGVWIDHLKAAGFATGVHNETNMTEIKGRHGIKPGQSSCHTAVSPDGYVFEGHIPAKYIKRFLAEKPANAIGLAVPGMPVGSPGMEMGDRFEPYRIVQINKDGSTTVYAEVASPTDQ